MGSTPIAVGSGLGALGVGLLGGLGAVFGGRLAGRAETRPGHPGTA